MCFGVRLYGTCHAKTRTIATLAKDHPCGRRLCDEHAAAFPAAHALALLLPLEPIAGMYTLHPRLEHRLLADPGTPSILRVRYRVSLKCSITRQIGVAFKNKIVVVPCRYRCISSSCTPAWAKRPPQARHFCKFGDWFISRGMKNKLCCMAHGRREPCVARLSLFFPRAMEPKHGNMTRGTV